MATLDSPIILVNINEFITKKTCARLFAVSKIMKSYLKLKQFKLLDTSDLSKIKMIINSDLEINFMIFIQTFKIFRYLSLSLKSYFSFQIADFDQTYLRVDQPYG